MFPTICGHPFGPKNPKYPKKITKQHRQTFEPVRSSHVVLHDLVLIDLKFHFRIDAHIASFFWGENPTLEIGIIFRKYTPKTRNRFAPQHTVIEKYMALSLNIGSYAPIH